MADPVGGLPALSVRRPYLAAVLNLLIIIAGVSALLGVEVRELPDVDRPIVTVRANFPGASPETLDAEVTKILEGAVARVNGVIAQERSRAPHLLRVVANSFTKRMIYSDGSVTFACFPDQVVVIVYFTRGGNAQAEKDLRRFLRAF